MGSGCGAGCGQVSLTLQGGCLGTWSQFIKMQATPFCMTWIPVVQIADYLSRIGLIACAPLQHLSASLTYWEPDTGYVHGT